jgi:hypothetical protein
MLGGTKVVKMGMAFVLIWSLQLAGLHMPKNCGSGVHDLRWGLIVTGSSTVYRGKPLIFQEKIPYEFIRMSDPRSESKAPLPVPKMQSAFIRVHDEALSVVAVRVGNPDLEKPRLLPTESFLSDPSDDLIADDF